LLLPLLIEAFTPSRASPKLVFEPSSGPLCLTSFDISPGIERVGGTLEPQFPTPISDGSAVAVMGTLIDPWDAAKPVPFVASNGDVFALSRTGSLDASTMGQGLRLLRFEYTPTGSGCCTTSSNCEVPTSLDQTTLLYIEGGVAVASSGQLDANVTVVAAASGNTDDQAYVVVRGTSDAQGTLHLLEVTTCTGQVQYVGQLRWEWDACRALADTLGGIQSFTVTPAGEYIASIAGLSNNEAVSYLGVMTVQAGSPEEGQVCKMATTEDNIGSINADYIDLVTKSGAVDSTSGDLQGTTQVFFATFNALIDFLKESPTAYPTAWRQSFSLSTPIAPLQSRLSAAKVFFGNTTSTGMCEGSAVEDFESSPSDLSLFSLSSDALCLTRVGGEDGVITTESSLTSPISKAQIRGRINLADIIEGSASALVPLPSILSGEMAWITQNRQIKSGAVTDERAVQVALVTLASDVTPTGCCDNKQNCKLPFTTRVVTPADSTAATVPGLTENELANIKSEQVSIVAVSSAVSAASGGGSVIYFVSNGPAVNLVVLFQVDLTATASTIAIVRGFRRSTGGCSSGGAMFAIRAMHFAADSTLYLLVVDGSQLSQFGLEQVSSNVEDDNPVSCLLTSEVDGDGTGTPSINSALSSKASLLPTTDEEGGAGRGLLALVSGTAVHLVRSGAGVYSVGEMSSILPPVISTLSMSGALSYVGLMVEEGVEVVGDGKAGAEAIGGVLTAVSIASAVVDTVVSGASSAASSANSGGGIAPGADIGGGFNALLLFSHYQFVSITSKLKASLTPAYEAYSQSFSWSNLFIAWPWLDDLSYSNVTLPIYTTAGMRGGVRQGTSTSAMGGGVSQDAVMQSGRRLLQTSTAAGTSSSAAGSSLLPVYTLLAVFTTIILLLVVAETIFLSLFGIGVLLSRSSKPKLHKMGDKLRGLGTAFAKKIPLQILLFAFYSVVSNGSAVLAAVDESVGVQLVVGIIMLGWVGAAIALGVMVVRRNRDKLFDANVIRSFGMYYKNYNMSNTMFFVIDLSYKFGEALFISILPDGGAQVGVMLVLEIALLVVVVIRRPFRTREDFAFIVAMTAGRIIVLFLSIALLPGVVEGVSQSGQDAVGYLMMAFQICITLLGLGLTALRMRKKFVAMCKKKKAADRQRATSIMPRTIRRTSSANTSAQPITPRPEPMSDFAPPPPSSPPPPIEGEQGPSLSANELKLMIESEGMSMNPQFAKAQEEKKGNGDVGSEERGKGGSSKKEKVKDNKKRRDSGIPKSLRKNLRFGLPTSQEEKEKEEEEIPPPPPPRIEEEEEEKKETSGKNNHDVLPESGEEPNSDDSDREMEGRSPVVNHHLKAGTSTYATYSPRLHMLGPIDEEEEEE